VNAVAHGLGISLVSEFAARDSIRQKTVRPIKLKVNLPERKFYYVQKKNVSHSHLVDLFAAFLEEEQPPATGV